MRYIYELRGLRNGDRDYLGSFEPLEIGETIEWGGDDKEPDGLKRWEVVREVGGDTDDVEILGA